MMPDNNSYLQKMQSYPKRNLVWGRDIPDQGNISREDMLDYLKNNYQNMKHPTSPVPGNILNRFGNQEVRALNNTQFRDYNNLDLLMDARDKYIRNPPPPPQEYQSGWGHAIDAPMNKITADVRATTDYGTKEGYYIQLFRNSLMRSMLPLINRLMQKQSEPENKPKSFDKRPDYDSNKPQFRNFSPIT